MMSHCGITLILYFTLWDNPNPLLVATRGGKTSSRGHKLVGARVPPPLVPDESLTDMKIKSWWPYTGHLSLKWDPPWNEGGGTLAPTSLCPHKLVLPPLVATSRGLGLSHNVTSSRDQKYAIEPVSLILLSKKSVNVELTQIAYVMVDRL